MSEQVHQYLVKIHGLKGLVTVISKSSSLFDFYRNQLDRPKVHEILGNKVLFINPAYVETACGPDDPILAGMVE